MENNQLTEINRDNSSDSLETSQLDGEIIFSDGGQGFQEGEVIRVEIYEEVPTIHRETHVREKVEIRKVLTPETDHT
ncbi:MAG: DUF2382 domain-containing protein [Leptolyngbyaceae cyanobacterium RU_5_1]|nr:DUF2382 domain-containing protein [Leptolyngbyaceae cyanobacterium RU_5_1]